MSAAARRLRFGAITAAVVLSTLACAVMVNILAARLTRPFDVTATGEHRLAPRTASVLARLGEGFEIILAADARALDRDLRRDLSDVLDQFARAGVGVYFIDTGADSGHEEYRRLLRRLAERDRPAVEQIAGAAENALGGLLFAADALERGVSPALAAVAEALPHERAFEPVRATLDQRAGAARIAARELRRAAELARDTLAADPFGVGVPAVDRGAATVREAGASAAAQIDDLARELRQFAAVEELPAAARERASMLAADLAGLRDRLLLLLDPLGRLKRPAFLRIAEALGSRDAALIVGPPEVGLTAVDLADLAGAPTAVDAGGTARADVRRRTEELFVSALASLVDPARPIVVFIHGEPRPFFDKTPLFTALLERLALRGIDTIEWAVLQSPDPPRLSALNPDRARPVVYVSLAPDSTSGAGPAGEATGAQRAQALGRALARLADDGAPLLLSINPSVLPTYGDVDPVSAVARRFGVRAESGRPILRARAGARATVEADMILQPVPDAHANHPIAGAVRGLPAFFGWVTPLFIDAAPAPGAAREVIYRIEPGDELWSETQWLRLWQTPADQRPFIPDPPAFDPARDARDGPWGVVVAAERREEGALRRMVVVGSNNWYADFVTQARTVVDGRAVPRYPGNAELFEAAVLWLAGQDALVAQSPLSRSLPLIQNLGERRVALIRLLVIAVLPLGVLLLGLLYRAARG